MIDSFLKNLKYLRGRFDVFDVSVATCSQFEVVAFDQTRIGFSKELNSHTSYSLTKEFRVKGYNHILKCGILGACHHDGEENSIHNICPGAHSRADKVLLRLSFATGEPQNEDYSRSSV